MEVIKVEPDLDTESLNRSPVYEDPLFDETENQGQDPLVIKSAEVKREFKVSVIFISYFRRVLNVVCFLLGNSRASEFYMPTFRNTLSHLHRRIGILHTYLPMNMEQTECSKTSSYKIQTPGNYPEESMQQSESSFVACLV